MSMTPKVIVPPEAEPLTLDECRAHLEAQTYGDSDVDSVDDAMIEGWLAAAREYCEEFLGLSLSTRVLEIALDSFPTRRKHGSLAIDLPMGPVRSIVSVTVPLANATGHSIDSDGAVNPADYVLDTYRNPNQLRPVSAWPTLTASTAGVRIQYLAGYGVDSDGGEPLPPTARAAMLLMLGHLYRNREATIEAAMSRIPLGVESLLRTKRVRLGMA